MAGLVNYFCEQCKRSRKTIVLPDVHNINLAESANGLVTYSDIHRCKGEIYGISNIHIDAHYNVRGVEYMKLPKSAVLLAEEPKSFIPVPSSAKTGAMLIITDLVPDQAIKMIYRNKNFNYQIRVGKPHKSLEPVKTIFSPTKNSSLEYFESDIILTPELEAWFELLVELIEEHPPVTVGLIIEALFYIFEHPDKTVEVIDKKLLRELFTCHLTKVQIADSHVETALKILENKLSDEMLAKMKMIVADIDLTPNPHIYDMATLSKDLISLILNLYLLEKLDVIRLDRSEINDETSDLQIRKSILT